MVELRYTINIEDLYYELLSKSKAHSFKGLTFNEYYKKNWEFKIGFSLKEVLCGNFEKLVMIKNNNTKYRKNKELKELFNYDKKTTKNLRPKISKLQPKISAFIEANTNVGTCHFCNIDYINKFQVSSGETKNGFTLDHFFDKGTYPFLALSIYNLIPSCYICNSKVKLSKDIGLMSPSSSTFEFDCKVKFRTFFNKNIEIKTDEDFNLLLKEDFSNLYTKYIDVLELNGRYKFHKYKVIEMINKRKKYPDTKIKELAILMQQTEEQVKEDLFGIFKFNDLGEKSFTKLIKDISLELGLT